MTANCSYVQPSTWITNVYGGRRGWLKHLWFSLLDHLGAYEQYRAIRWERVHRLVFVCTGNICRSPYCEARARALGLEACSCGLSAGENDPANAMAIAVGRTRGLDLTWHRSRKFQISKLISSDLLIAMEPAQAQELRRTVARTQTQVTILGLWNFKSRPYLRDPYGLGQPYFETCFAFLDQSIQQIAAEIKQSRAL
jgi:protein-tyrosine phosphatase